MQLVGQKKTKTFREHCNATITRVEPIIKLTIGLDLDFLMIR